jgi:hypothetical protein
MSFVADPRLRLPGRPPLASAFASPQPGPRAVAPRPSTQPEPDGVDRFVVALVTADLVLMTLLQKVAMPLSGEAQVSSLLITHYALLGVLLLARRATLDPMRLALCAGFSGLALFSQIWPDRPFTPTSLLLAVAIYAALVFVMPISPATHRRILLNYQLVAVAVCLLVFLDHAIQLTGREIPNLELVLPAATIYKEFVYIQPLYWGSPYSKPNAIFLLEASTTSQYIAIGLVLELAFFQRLRYLLLFGCALIATFAGTGLLLVLLSGPLLLRRLRPALLAAGVVAAVVALVLAAASGWFEVVAKRLDEHEKSGSSAYARFIAPVETVSDLLAGEPETVLFGTGAGSIERRPGIVWMPFAKVIVEYGVIGFLAWFGYFSVAMLGGGAPLIAAWVALIQYHLLNGSFLVPLNAFLCCVLAAGYRIVPRAEPPAAARSTAARRPVERPAALAVR